MWKTIQKSLSSVDSFVSLILGLAVVLVVGMLVFNYISGRKGGIPKPEAEKAAQEKLQKLPTEHIVASRETLWNIAEKYYQSGYNWVDIQKANNLANPDYIEVGQKLTIPDAKPIVVSGQISATQTQALKPKQESYKVVSGDNLWEIAEREYGDGFKWVNIAEANKLANPDLIHAGNILTLPTIP
ncbi:MAG: LysM peptidoglycan-binding domain-containing protein [Patescibacteria group bacterium]